MTIKNNITTNRRIKYMRMHYLRNLLSLTECKLIGTKEECSCNEQCSFVCVKGTFSQISKLRELIKEYYSNVKTRHYVYRNELWIRIN